MSHPVESNSPLVEEVILPAPPEIEITTTNGERDAMDDYVQDFGAYQYGYNIRKGNSTTGVICHYHCHRGGHPLNKTTKLTKRPTKSARIGCKFKLTARPNHEKKSWMLIHAHLGHNHPPDYTIKARKRKPRTVVQPIKTQLIHTHLAISEPQPITVPHVTESNASHKTDSNTSPKRFLTDVSARLEAMTPTTRQQKVEQIKCILNEESTLASNFESNHYHMYKSQEVVEDHTTLEELLDQMLQDILVPLCENESPESPDNSHIQVESELIPSPCKIDNHFSETGNIEAHPTQTDSRCSFPLVDKETLGIQVCQESNDSSITYPLDPTPPICQRITRRQARQLALTQKPSVTNPVLPALLTKYEIPFWLVDFVRDLHEVKANGHCGFRAISVAIGQPQDEWLLVRTKLADTIEAHPDCFTQRQLPGTRSEALARLRTSKPNVLTEQESWLSMPGFGGVIATAFDRPVIYYGPDSNHLIMFPYASPPNENPPIVLSLCNYHYCSLTLDYTLPNLPVPRMCPIWRRYASLEASRWADNWEPLIEKHAAALKKQQGTRKSKRRKQVTIDVE
ncbi:hypothetical protein DFH28DRAFT_893100 [Melampsora americana]|nr:hypothetical protein DFH28DRAFT_893100 [Melampsora americana]